MFIRFVLVVVLCAAVANSQDYCNAKLCGKGKTHIGCRNSGGFAARCSKNARMVSRSTVKGLVVKLHNAKRNLIAGGSLPGYEPAVRMGTMQWDDGLAKMAELNVKQCQMKHDQCRNTYTYSKSGQNLAIISFTGGIKRTDADLVSTRIDAWWNEYKNANMNIIRKYPKGYSGPAIGHFTVFVAEKNIRCGCGAIRYTDGKWTRFLMACNYATTNIVGLPLYQSGRTASWCLTGRNPLYPNLCSVNEKYTGL